MATSRKTDSQHGEQHHSPAGRESPYQAQFAKSPGETAGSERRVLTLRDGTRAAAILALALAASGLLFPLSKTANRFAAKTLSGDSGAKHVADALEEVYRRIPGYRENRMSSLEKWEAEKAKDEAWKKLAEIGDRSRGANDQEFSEANGDAIADIMTYLHHRGWTIDRLFAELDREELAGLPREDDLRAMSGNAAEAHYARAESLLTPSDRSTAGETPFGRSLAAAMLELETENIGVEAKRIRFAEWYNSFPDHPVRLMGIGDSCREFGAPAGDRSGDPYAARRSAVLAETGRVMWEHAHSGVGPVSGSCADGVLGDNAMARACGDFVPPQAKLEYIQKQISHFWRRAQELLSEGDSSEAYDHFLLAEQYEQKITWVAEGEPVQPFASSEERERFLRGMQEASANPLFRRYIGQRRSGL